MNYFSLWIANLGVVPLFSLAFFLLRPAFLLLKFLLVRVIVVFDAIYMSSVHLLNNRTVKLTTLLLFVKVFVLTPTTFAEQQNHSIFLSRGSQRIVNLATLKKYSIGNKEVIKVKFQKNAAQLLINAKSMGFSDLVVWTKTRTLKYKIYVISKREYLKKIRLTETLEQVGLKVTIVGDIIHIKGKISNAAKYKIYKATLERSPLKIVREVHIEKGLRNKIIESIYNESYKHGSEYSICEFKMDTIYCLFRGVDRESVGIKNIVKNYSLKKLQNNKLSSTKNYLVKFKIIKINKSKEQVRDLGVQSLHKRLTSIFNNQKNIFIEGDFFSLKNTDIQVTVLAEPQFLTIQGDKTKLRLGGEFPVQASGQNGITTSWKFYGLSLEVLLAKKFEKLIVSYKSSLTTPMNEKVTGSQGSASVYLPINKYKNLFQIDYDQEREYEEYLPIIGKIPLLRYLFSKKSQGHGQQQVLCFMKVEVQKNEL